MPSSLWLPVSDISIERSPNVILPTLLRNNRQPLSVAVPGIRGIAGNLVSLLWPDAGMELFVGAIGAESSTTGSTPTNSTTLAASADAGATTISTTATFAMNDIVQIDSSPGFPECRKVTAVTGSGPYSLTLDAALSRAHASAAAVSKVVAPFTHTATPTAALPSFSIEKNMNGADIQYGGCLVSKCDLALATNAAVKATYAIVGQQDQVLASPAAPTWPTDTPYSPTGITFTAESVPDTTCHAGTFSLDNMVKAYDTFNGHDYPDLVIPTERKLTMGATLFLQSLSGSTPPNYYAELEGAGAQAVQLAFAQGTDQVTIALPAAVLTKAANPIRLGDLVMQDVEYTAIIGGANNTDLTVTITNGIYQSY